MHQKAFLNGTFQVSAAGQYYGNHDRRGIIRFRLIFTGWQRLMGESMKPMKIGQWISYIPQVFALSLPRHSQP